MRAVSSRLYLLIKEVNKEIFLCEKCNCAVQAESKFCPSLGEKLFGYAEELTLILPNSVTKIKVRY